MYARCAAWARVCSACFSGCITRYMTAESASGALHSEREMCYRPIAVRGNNNNVNKIIVNIKQIAIKFVTDGRTNGVRKNEHTLQYASARLAELRHSYSVHN